MHTYRLATRRHVLASAVASAATGLAAPAIGQRARVLRYGSMLPADSIYHRACVMFGDELAKLSSGKLKVEVYPDSQLGTIPEMMSSVQTGSLQMTMAVSAWFSKFMKPLDAFTLPYIVPSADQLKTALDGALGQRIAAMGESTGFQIIGYWLIGGRHIVNKLRPVNKPADCAGLKIRVINSQVYIQTFRALGATAVAMDPSELYLALQQGVVDGFEYPLPDLIAYKFASSEKSVGDIRLRQLAKCVIQRDFRDVEGAEAVGFSHGQFGLVVETLDHAAGELLPGAEVVQDQRTMRA